MNSGSYKFVHFCALCRKKKLKKIFSLKPIPFGEKYFLTKKQASLSKKVSETVSVCENCKNVQISEIINPKDLWKNYTYLSGQTEAIKKHFKAFSGNIIKKYKLNSNDYVLDIGSNDGSLLKNFKLNKIKVVGVDPASNVCRIANKNGILTYNSIFNKEIASYILQKHGIPKIITAFNVFAHTQDMKNFLDNAKVLMDGKTIFIFEVQYLRDIIEKKILGTFIHEHISHYSIYALLNFFQSNKINFFDVKRVNIQKGSILGFASKDYSIKKTSIFKKLLNYEVKKKIFTDKKIKQSFLFIEKNKKKCQNLISRFYGKTITAYGAARSGPVFSENYNLSNYIKFIFDDHVLKKNRFSSINSALVLPTKCLYKIRTHLCFIFAYLHQKKIVKKNIKYLIKGGNFVSIYPEVTLISKSNYKKFI